MIDIKEVMWLAGLLEGEGSFIPGPPSKPNLPLLVMTMTDEDVVAKAADILGVNYQKLKPKRYKGTNWKNPFLIQIRGKRAVSWMLTLYPLMGLRRQTQIKKAVNSYNIKHRKLNPAKVKDIKRRLKEGVKVVDLAKKYRVHHTHISKIKHGKSWTEVHI
jgi:hypothetical protein